MLLFRSILISLIVSASVVALIAQTQDAVVATANGIAVKMSELPSDVRNLLDPQAVAAAELQSRTQLFEEFVNRRVLHLHFDKTGKTVTEIYAEITKNARKPTQNEIANTLAANRDALSQYSESEARARIEEFLISQIVRPLYSAFIVDLRTQYRVTPVANAATPGRRPTDTIVTIDGESIAVAEFESFIRLPINDRKHHRFHTAESAIEQILFDKVLEKEAALLGITSNVLIQREVSSKLQTFSDDEIASVNAAFRERLYKKYNVKVSLPHHDDVRIEIPIADSPSIGAANAPVTIVMFSDFQCGACAAAHPMLKTIAGEFPGKVRIVIKYFPLESIHDNALGAARAAFAANEQGKFPEFADILYREQRSLSDAKFDEIAAAVGLNVERFKQDRVSPRSLSAVRRDIVFGDNIGIIGTPSVFVDGKAMTELSLASLRRVVGERLK